MEQKKIEHLRCTEARGLPQVKTVKQQDPSNRVPDSWPHTLKGLHRAATSALEGLRRARQQPLSGRESVERDDLLTMMEAMANPKKTAAVYFAMAEAMSAGDGGPLSDRDLAEAEELCRAFEQGALTAEELQAVERLARKRHAESVG
jgi:hypothetical protein